MDIVAQDDRYICTADAPWTPDRGRRATHPDAKHLRDTDWGDSYTATYLCPNCHKQFTNEIPQ